MKRKGDDTRQAVRNMTKVLRGLVAAQRINTDKINLLLEIMRPPKSISEQVREMFRERQR